MHVPSEEEDICLSTLVPHRQSVCFGITLISNYMRRCASKMLGFPKGVPAGELFDSLMRHFGVLTHLLLQQQEIIPPLGSAALPLSFFVRKRAFSLQSKDTMTFTYISLLLPLHLQTYISAPGPFYTLFDTYNLCRTGPTFIYTDCDYSMFHLRLL